MDIGFPEFFVVFVIVMLVFGPNRIASLGGELGKTIRDFREGLSGDSEEDISIPLGKDDPVSKNNNP